MTCVLWLLLMLGGFNRDMHPLDFTEGELFQAFSWGMDESSARTYAHELAGDDPTAAEEGASVGYSHFNEEFLVVISLVSEEARNKAEKRVAELHGGHLSSDELSLWEKRREEVRSQLIKAGKMKP